jgi:hypothetical protein
MAVALRTEQIQTTIHALNLDFAGRIGSDEYDPLRTVHIHRRNRPYVWNFDMQEKCLDSILKGYYIPPIICCSHIVDGVERREVMEGGNRITTFRRIITDQVRKLTDLQKNTVNSHPITLVVMRGLSGQQQREMFRRLNKNVKVSDGQLYSMSEDDSPLVSEAIKLLNDANHPLRARITSTFFDTVDNDSDAKKNLENAVALISGCLNGVDYITKSFMRQEIYVENQDPIDRNKVIVTLGLVLDVFRMADDIFPITNKKMLKAQWPIGKYLGVILYDILVNPADVHTIQQKWANYMVLVRRGETNAIEAIEIKGAQNINADKLKKKSAKVDIFLREKRLASDEELKEIKHSNTVYEEEDEEDQEDASSEN